jgi:hypothetical protein
VRRAGRRRTRCVAHAWIKTSLRPEVLRMYYVILGVIIVVLVVVLIVLKKRGG